MGGELLEYPAKTSYRKGRKYSGKLNMIDFKLN